MNGWIKIHRKITEWGWYADTNTFRVFFHLLITANHEPNEWNGIVIERGQTVIGSLNLAKELSLSRRNIRTAIEHLKSTNEIATKPTNKYTIVTICKFDDYQDKKMQADQQTDQQTDQRPTTLKEDKNIKEYNTNYSDDFENFFNSYHDITKQPKTDKQPTFKAWQKLKSTEKTIAMNNIKLHSDSYDEPKYRGKARTYVTDKKFNNEFKQQPKPKEYKQTSPKFDNYEL